MKKRLRILHLEDEPDFTELVRTLLAQEKVEAEIKQVDGREAFLDMLARESFDIIVSDFHLPAFTGLEALKIARQKAQFTPFILVSGTIGEQAAIESLKAGATDYVLKQNPDRLPSAIVRAVAEAEEHAKLRQAEKEISRSEKYYRTLTENSLDILFIFSPEAKFIHVSPSVHRVLGYDPGELIGRGAYERIHADDQAEVKRAFQKALENPQETVKLRFRCRHRDGSWCHLEALGLNRVSDPEIGGLVVNCRDVTDRWRAEEELRGSEKQYRLLFQGNPNPMWVFDLETLAFLEVNEAAVHHYGYTRKDFLAMTIADIRQPTVGVQENPASGEAVDRGLVWRHRRKDGKIIDAEVVWSPIVFRGRFAALTMATDVTERRRIQHRNAAFSKLSHRLSSATTASEAALIICEVADELFKWDDFALDLYSTEKDEVFSLLNITTVEGQRVEIPPSPQPKTVNALVQRVITNGAELLSPAEAKSHSASTMLAPIRKGERVIGILFVQNRVTSIYSRDDLETLQTLADQSGGALERLRAEQGLRESQQRFRDLFENSPDAILVESLEGIILDANAAASLLCGVPRDQLAGKNGVYDIVPRAGQEIAWQQHQRMVRGEISQAEGEILTTDGRTVPIEARAARIEYNGRPALLFHLRDITERHAAEAALRSSETLFRSVWENSADGMRLTDEEGVIIAVNSAFCKLVGMEQEELEGKPFSVVFAGSEDCETMLEQHRESFRTSTLQVKKERAYKLRDGREVIFEITDSFVELRGKPLLALSLFRDVSMQRRLEEQLRQSQKMEAIGQLAGGVAHDFNNILTVIHGHASLLTMSDLDDTATRSALQISQAAERAAGLTRQLLTFSRRQLIQPKRLDMNKIVGNMTDMLGRLLGEDIALQLNYCHTPAMVEADAGMMEQVLLNLAVNARDAMPRGGQLAVRIALVEVKEEHVKIHPEARVGKFVCVSKSDTGTGIPAENLSRIFEPFFTTKEVGKGTGLGLATVYGIVKQHQGWIEVSSELGKGTTFRVYIPYLGAAPVEAERPAKPISVNGGNETILLVEDERPVRELVSRVLQKHGYKILTAATGDEAVEVWNNRNCEIHLLLTDLIMPGNMNGRELAEKICSEHPGIKVVFTSGYSADIVGRDFKLEPEVNFLQKPYHPQTLALTVRRCLDRKQN